MGIGKKLPAGVAIIGIGIAAILTGCSSSGKGGFTPKTDTVVIEGMEFHPAELTVRQGDTVIWVNNGIVAHNVTEDTAQTWTSGDINVGDSWKMVAEESFHYICTIHPTMKGAISVTKD